MTSRSSSWETAILLMLAIFLAGAPLVLFHAHPVAFAHLIAEDFQGEYAAAAAFAVAALLFLADAWRAPSRSRRMLSAVFALAALVIAGEEVSWGDRLWYALLGFARPDALQAWNLQGELNLHNLEFVGLSPRTYHFGSYLLLTWLAVSALLFRIGPGLAARLTAAGIPLVPLRLIPLCLLPAFFFLLGPVVKADEVGELMLGVAALAYALDRASSTGWLAKGWLAARPQALVLSLLAVGLIGVLLASVSPQSHISWRLHALAARDYPELGMYEQAEAIFDHIDRHSVELGRADTPLVHAEVLVAAGKMIEARAMLAAALDNYPDPTALDGDSLCRIGQLYDAFGEQESADKAFAAAIAADRRALEAAEDADQRAELMWSMARTLRAQGRPHEATSAAAQAQRTATSARLRRELAHWLQELEAAAPRDVRHT